ncbi:MAG: PLP-dependent aminotransferase family protein [Rhodobiaceae bacterium]|nr:PLP-dependent aminotransferase family protein [Rhodobiaceae bacterium]
MTFWTKALETGTGPAYRRLADGLHAAIANNLVSIGDRLPPQRELAYELGVSIGTITRAYDLATRRGDITAVTGKGSFVASVVIRSDESAINLRINLPADIGQGVDLAAALSQRSAAEFLSYIPFGGSEADRQAGVTYLNLGGVTAAPDDLIVTAGGQHALTTALMVTTKPGDTVLCEPFTFAGFLDYARLTDRKIIAIPADKEGIRPAAFEELCRQYKPAAAFLTPTAQNPTGTNLSEHRRRAIAKSAHKHGTMIIEDGIYDPLMPEPPITFHELVPDQTFYIASLSKTVAPGLRVGYLICPPAHRDEANDIQHLLGMGPPQAMANLTTALIESGSAETMTRAQAREIAARQELARAIVDHKDNDEKIFAPHYWLPLPKTWTPERFVAAAEAEGVLLSPSGHFAVEAPSNHVRLALGAAADRNILEEALTKLAQLLEKNPTRASRSV